jgi:hypothetical protein
MRDRRRRAILRQFDKAQADVRDRIVWAKRDRAMTRLRRFAVLVHRVSHHPVQRMRDWIVGVPLRNLARKIESAGKVAVTKRLDELLGASIFIQGLRLLQDAIRRALHQFFGRRKFLQELIDGRIGPSERR